MNQWIAQYTNGNPDASAEMKAKYPLAEARVEVKEFQVRRVHTAPLLT